MTSTLWLDTGDVGTAWVGYDYGENRADDPTDDYVQASYGVGYEIRFGRRDRLDLELEFRPRRYAADVVETGTGPVLRRDERWVTSAAYRHRFRWGQEIIMEGELERRDSTDPDKVYEAVRVELSLRWPLVR